LVEFKFDYFVENPVMIWLLNGENMLCAQHLKRSTRLKDMHISLVRTIGTILDSGVAAGTIRRDVDPPAALHVDFRPELFLLFKWADIVDSVRQRASLGCSESCAARTCRRCDSGIPEPSFYALLTSSKRHRNWPVNRKRGGEGRK
jgi:hypothetical protein